MTDAFSRLLLEDPTAPIEPEAVEPAIVFEPLPAERPESDTGWLIVQPNLFGRHVLPPIGGGAYLFADSRGPDAGNPHRFASRAGAQAFADRNHARDALILPYPRWWARIYRDGPVLTGVQWSFATYAAAAEGRPAVVVPLYRNDVSGRTETYVRVHHFLRTGEMLYEPLLPASYHPSVVEELEREVETYWAGLGPGPSPGWVVALRTESGNRYAMDGREPRRFASRDTAESLLNQIRSEATESILESDVFPAPAMWVAYWPLPERDVEGATFHATYEEAALNANIVLPCYDPDHGREEVAARTLWYRRTGAWPLGQVTWFDDSIALPIGQVIGSLPGPDPIEPAGDLVPEDGTPQAAPLVQPGDGVDWRVGDTDLEWVEIVPFLRGWAMMIRDVAVESATRTWVVDEPVENSGLAAIVLTSTVGPGRVTVIIRRTGPLTSTAFDATTHTQSHEVTAYGHFMRRVGESVERLEAFLRAHLAGVRAPG